MSFLSGPAAACLTDERGYKTGTSVDPVRVDPTGTTVQPVSFSSAQHVIVDSGGGGGTQYADGTTQATPTGSVALGKDPSNVLKSLPLDAAGLLKVNVAAGGAGGGAVTVADGADVAQGTTTDAAAVSDVAGTLSAKLRGLVKIFADVWDSVNHHLKVDGSGVTQPVSIAAMPSTPVTGTFWQATQPVSGTVTTSPPANASTNVAQVGGVAVAAVAKATQATNAIGTQDLKDSGRVIKVFSAANFTAATTEALITLTPVADGTAGSTGTSFAVTAGKRLRLVAMSLSVNAPSTTSVGAVVNLRMSASGAVTASSPLIATCGAGLVGTQVAQCAASGFVDFPDGIELSGTMQLGISQKGIASAGFNVTLIGYEY